MSALRDNTGLSPFVARVRDVGGLSDLNSIKLRDEAGLHTVWSNGPVMTVEIMPFASGAASSNGTTSVSSEDIAAVVTGGRAPYSYAWSRVGGPLAPWNILFPSSASTRIMHGAVDANDSVTSSFICTVTDSGGLSVASNQCEVNLSNFGGFE